MRDFAFAEATPRLVPTHNRSTLVIAALIHALFLAVLIQVKTKPDEMEIPSVLGAIALRAK